MIRWASNASANDVSPEIYSYQDPAEYFTNKYVVAALKNVQSAGLPAVGNIKDEIEQQVINRKKGETIVSNISSQDLAEIGAQYSVKVDTASSVNFTAAFVPNLGAEPKVLGTAYHLAENETSKPIIGNSGVFVVKMMRNPITGQATNIPQLRPNYQRTERQKVNGQILIQAMRKKADVTDNRFRFY